MNDKSRGVLIRTSVQLLKAFSSYDEPFTARQVSLSSGVGLRRVYRWIKVMKEAIKSTGSQFSARRMVKEYTEKFYVQALKNAKNLK